MLACIPSGLVPRSANHIKHILLLALPPHHTTPQLFTVLRPFFRNHPGEPMPEENFWTLWWKGRLTEADTQTIWLGATPSRLTLPVCYKCQCILHIPPKCSRWFIKPQNPENRIHMAHNILLNTGVATKHKVRYKWFSLTRFSPDTSLLFAQFPGISLTAIKLLDIASFSTQVVMCSHYSIMCITWRNLSNISYVTKMTHLAILNIVYILQLKVYCT